MIEEFPQVWAPTRPAAAMGWLGVVLAVGWIVACLAGGIGSAVDGDLGALLIGIALAGLIGLPLGAAGWLLGVRPRLIAETEGVRVRNPRQETFVRWADIADVSAGYGGITIRTASGDSIRAWAVQKSNAASWSRRRTRADDVTDFIRRHASAGPDERPGA